MSLLILLAQCVCMFIASFAVGSLPLMFKSATQGEWLRLHARDEAGADGRHSTQGDFDPWDGIASRSSLDHYHT